MLNDEYKKETPHRFSSIFEPLLPFGLRVKLRPDKQWRRYLKERRKKMKVKFIKGFSGLSGKMDELVLCIEKKSGACWVRDYVKPRETEHNHEVGNATRNMGVFKSAVSSGYFNNLKDYADRYNLHTLGISKRLNSFTTLMKALYILKDAVPEVDLLTITPEEVVANEYPLRTVKEAIEYGLLPSIPRCDDLDNFIL
jgi:hypothetical protein